jgi:hypothetical protein
MTWSVHCLDLTCSSADWGHSENVVWGSACGGADCQTGSPPVASAVNALLSGGLDAQTIVWGTTGAHTIVWGTTGAQTIVWGTTNAQTIVWGTTDGQTIVWGTTNGQTIVWGTSGCNDPSCQSVIWGQSGGGP